MKKGIYRVALRASVALSIRSSSLIQAHTIIPGQLPNNSVQRCTSLNGAMILLLRGMNHSATLEASGFSTSMQMNSSMRIRHRTFACCSNVNHPKLVDYSVRSSVLIVLAMTVQKHIVAHIHGCFVTMVILVSHFADESTSKSPLQSSSAVVQSFIRPS